MSFAIMRESPAAKPFVFLQSLEGWVKRPVDLGIENNVAVVVKSGLKQGDVVATGSPAAAKVETGKAPS